MNASYLHIMHHHILYVPTIRNRRVLATLLFLLLVELKDFLIISYGLLILILMALLMYLILCFLSILL